jgi:hypothetical protein
MQTERPIPDLSSFDPADHSWWQWREMGSPDDPYNQIPKMSPEDPQYAEYLATTEAGYEAILKEAESDDGWVFWKEEEGIKIHSKDHPDDPVRCFRGKGIIPATAEVLRLHLVQVDLRKYWDDMFLGGTYKIELTPTVRVCNYKFSAPWPVTARDFVIIAGEKITDDGAFVTVVNSIERDDIPVDDSFVRGVLKSSGFVIRPLENDPVTGKPRCEITYLVQLNPMGWIPTIVVNAVNVSQPLCINTLKNAILLTEAMVEEMLRKFTELPAEEWKADKLRRLLNKSIDNHNGKPEMLYEPIQYVITGKRIVEEDICVTMEKIGKDQSLYRMWKGSMPYLQSIANKELNAKAAEALANPPQ